MSGMDPIFLEVLWNRLLSVVNEQQVALMRTAFSTIVRETQDLACGVFNTEGAMVAQSLTGTPGHINAMATGMRHLLAEYPPERLSEGDVLLTNDPWMTAGQINDITVATPVFRQGRIVGYFANTCHAADIGGRLLSAEAREVYEEGLRLPIMKLFRRGKINRDLIKLIRANVRTPDETVGDLYAQTTSNEVGARALLKFMDEFDLDSIDPVAREIMDRSEEAMRQSIQTIPNGRYEHETWSDGFDEPIKIKVAVTVEDRDIHIDFAGSSPQSQRGINVVFNYTHAYASFAMKAAVSPDVPHNEGAFRPVHVSAPPGSIFNCRPPAAVASRHILGHFLPGVIFGALAEALPLMTAGSDPIWISVWRGRPAGKETSFLHSLSSSAEEEARALERTASAPPAFRAGWQGFRPKPLRPCPPSSSTAGNSGLTPAGRAVTGEAWGNTPRWDVAPRRRGRSRPWWTGSTIHPRGCWEEAPALGASFSWTARREASPRLCLPSGPISECNSTFPAVGDLVIHWNGIRQGCWPTWWRAMSR